MHISLHLLPSFGKIMAEGVSEMNRKLLAAVLLVLGLGFGYYTWHGILVRELATFSAAIWGALAGGCIGGAVSILRGKRTR